jgi:UDP-glucose 4-epimerase
MEKKVLILGGSGFIGRFFSAELTSTGGFEVETYSSTMLDLCDATAFKRIASILPNVDYLVVAAFRYAGKPTEAYFCTKNIEMIENLVLAMDGWKGHIIYLSSEAVYGHQLETITEASEVKPDTLYGKVHSIRETILAQSVSNLLIARLPMIIHPEDRHLAYGPNKFLLDAMQEKKISIYGRGEELRDFLGMSDLVYGLRKVIELGICGTLNFCSGQSFTYLQIAEHIQIQVPGSKISFSPRAMPIQNRVYDNHNFSAALNYQPKNILSLL